MKISLPHVWEASKVQLTSILMLLHIVHLLGFFVKLLLWFATTPLKFKVGVWSNCLQHALVQWWWSANFGHHSLKVLQYVKQRLILNDIDHESLLCYVYATLNCCCSSTCISFSSLDATLSFLLVYILSFVKYEFSFYGFVFAILNTLYCFLCLMWIYMIWNLNLLT